MEKFFFAKVSRNEIEIKGDFQVSLGNKLGHVFADWNWDGEKLTVSNDQFGFQPLFYFREGGKFAISPSLDKILEFTGNRDFNDDAFAVFLRLGWLIGEDTLFNSINALPPGSVLTWQRGSLKISSQGIIESKAITISYREAIETYAELFQKSIEKTLHDAEKFYVPLSAGRDSRHILFALRKAGKMPEACLTMVHPPPRPNDDLNIARQICETLDLKHNSIQQQGSRFSNETRKNKLTGFVSYENGWFLALGTFIDELSQTAFGDRVMVYDGIAGGVLSSGLFLTKERIDLYEQGKFEELADKIFNPEGYIPALLTKDLYQRFSRERAINYLIKELIRHADQANPVDSFFFWNRTRRCIAPCPFRLLGSSADVVTPFLDRDVFNFLTSLPADILVDRQFHTKTIAFAYPDYAHIPYENTDSPLNLENAGFRRFSRDILKYSLTRRNQNLIDRKFLVSRTMRGIFDKTYGPALTDFSSQAIHLLQLERL
ncbi:MAG: hypothetical protein H7070_14895 [Saprospiraceae bacterium]|nr:hypothetical protein [Pyrinomonadaceae bacterium]